MICKMSKKALRIEAEHLGAEEILGKRSNIYNYENARYNECRNNGYTYEGVAYSAGTFGNTGRIDRLVEYDPKTETWKHIKYIFYTE